MVKLEKVIDQVKKDLKKKYLNSPDAAWGAPFIAIISGAGEVSFIEGAKSEEQVIDWLVSFRQRDNIKGLVIGRMVQKSSDSIFSPDGVGYAKQKGILISGRMFDTGRTHVTVIPIKEHRDLRLPKIGEPFVQRDPILESRVTPEKVEPIYLDGEGTIGGFIETAFGKEEIYDSAQGQECMLDPIIEGVIATPERLPEE